MTPQCDAIIGFLFIWKILGYLSLLWQDFIAIETQNVDKGALDNINSVMIFPDTHSESK